MAKTKPSYLLHPVFIVSLFILLCNDLFWKAAYHNWLTGKLSDVAGIIILPLFLTQFFPAQKRFLFFLSAFFFAWWKSPLSDVVILFCNNHLLLPVERVVDYTDLFALLFLPGLYYLKPLLVNYASLLQTSLTIASGVVAFVSLCSTSMGYRNGLYSGSRHNRFTYNESFKVSKTEDEIINALKEKALGPIRDSIRFYPVINGDGLYYRITSRNDSVSQWKPVPFAADSSFYLRRKDNPFYVIPFYLLEADTLRNIEFTIHTPNARKRKSNVTIESFEVNNTPYYNSLNRKERKELKKKLERIFTE